MRLSKISSIIPIRLMIVKLNRIKKWKLVALKLINCLIRSLKYRVLRKSGTEKIIPENLSILYLTITKMKMLNS